MDNTTESMSVNGVGDSTGWSTSYESGGYTGTGTPVSTTTSYTSSTSTSSEWGGQSGTGLGSMGGQSGTGTGSMGSQSGMSGTVGSTGSGSTFQTGSIPGGNNMNSGNNMSGMNSNSPASMGSMGGQSNMNDRVVASDLLIYAKNGVKTYADAITEASTPAVRTMLKRQLDEAIAFQDQISSYMTKKGWYNAYNVNQQIQMDLNETESTINQLG